MWACICHMKPDLLDTHPLSPSSSSTHIANSNTNRPLLNVEIYDDLEAKKEIRFFKRGSCLVLKNKMSCMPSINKHTAHMAERRIREKTANNVPGIQTPQERANILGAQGFPLYA